MSCRMGCRVLPLRRVSLGTLSSFVAKYRACKRRRRPLENVLLRRRSSSSLTKASREPMAASVAGSGTARTEAGINNDSVVSCKQPGRGEKTWADSVQVPYKRKRHDVAHDSTRLGFETGAAAPGCRGQGTDRARSLASRYYATPTDCDTT
jgi:hypothetical protein